MLCDAHLCSAGFYHRVSTLVFLLKKDVINMYERLELIYTKEQLNKIKNTNILLVGVGGVGGSTLEALIRSGIQHITVIDKDTFEESNLNRQILSTKNNIGKSKVLEAQIRGLSINPHIDIKTYEMFLNESNINEIQDISKYDYIIDCCDTPNTKLLLIQTSIKYNIKIISSMGTGFRNDPSKLYITNIWNTEYDPLAKKMRKLLKENKINKKIPVLTSKEIPINKGKTIGSSYFVPNTAGIFIANYIFNDIINK